MLSPPRMLILEIDTLDPKVLNLAWWILPTWLTHILDGQGSLEYISLIYVFEIPRKICMDLTTFFSASLPCCRATMGRRQSMGKTTRASRKTLCAWRDFHYTKVCNRTRARVFHLWERTAITAPVLYYYGSQLHWMTIWHLGACGHWETWAASIKFPAIDASHVTVCVLKDVPSNVLCLDLHIQTCVSSGFGVAVGKGHEVGTTTRTVSNWKWCIGLNIQNLQPRYRVLSQGEKTPSLGQSSVLINPISDSKNSQEDHRSVPWVSLVKKKSTCFCFWSLIKHGSHLLIHFSSS